MEAGLNRAATDDIRKDDEHRKLKSNGTDGGAASLNGGGCFPFILSLSQDERKAPAGRG